MDDKDLIDSARQLAIRWSRLAEIGWETHGVSYDRTYASGWSDGQTETLSRCAKRLRDLLGMEDADWAYDFNGDYSI